jgi:ferredoxin
MELVKGLFRCYGVEASRSKSIRIGRSRRFVDEIGAFVEEVGTLKPKPLLVREVPPTSSGRVLLTDLVKSFSRKFGLKRCGVKTRLFGVVKVDRDRCTQCLVCPAVCPTGALKATEGRLIFSHSLCVSCKSCWEICPERAIKVDDVIRIEKLVRSTCLFKEELFACERCGSPFIPRRMLRKVSELLKLKGEAAKALRLCPSCRARQGLFLKDVG